MDNVSCPERNADCRCYDGVRHSVEFQGVSFYFMPLTSDTINEVNKKVEDACRQCALFCNQLPRSILSFGCHLALGIIVSGLLYMAGKLELIPWCCIHIGKIKINTEIWSI